MCDILLAFPGAKSKSYIGAQKTSRQLWIRHNFSDASLGKLHNFFVNNNKIFPDSSSAPFIVLVRHSNYEVCIFHARYPLKYFLFIFGHILFSRTFNICKQISLITRDQNN